MRYIFIGFCFSSMGVGLLVIHTLPFGILLTFFGIAVIVIGINVYIKEKRLDKKDNIK